METIQEAARVVTSKPVQRAVVNSVLLLSSTVPLLFLAGIASTLFFKNYVPDQVLSTPIHLQYGSSLHPYGLASIAQPPIKSQQEYDVSITLTMPPSPANIERGNFMISLHLLNPPADGLLQMDARKHADTREGFEDGAIVYSSRRPVLLPYVDPFVSLASRILFLFYHMFVPGANTQTLTIPLAEKVFFSKGSTVPSSAYIEVEAGQTVQIYHATLNMTAQLRGLRWLMFHHRIITYSIFTFLFWVCEVVVMGVTWAVWRYAARQLSADNTYKLQFAEQKSARIKEEEKGRDDSDVPRTFPTYGKQPPLKYEPDVKEELDEDERLMSELPMVGADADDEDEEDEESDGRQRDSGIGTSYSEGGTGSVRRRASRSSQR